jgi:hypothetical protein
MLALLHLFLLLMDVLCLGLLVVYLLLLLLLLRHLLLTLARMLLILTRGSLRRVLGILHLLLLRILLRLLALDAEKGEQLYIHDHGYNLKQMEDIRSRAQLQKTPRSFNKICQV